MRDSFAPLRVLMLSTYFPKPGNMLLGNWALSQAQALQRNGMELQVVSCTAWVPRWAAVSPGAQVYASCPPEYTFDSIRVNYPRWPIYPSGFAERVVARHPIKPMQLGWWFVRESLLATVKSLKPDLIYAHHTSINGYLAWKLSQTTGIPYVITDHDFGEIESCRQYPERKRLFENIYRNCAGVVAVSRRMEGSLKDLFPFVSACTVYNGADGVRPEVLRRNRPEALQGKLVIFSCGAFSPRKAFPLLIDAFSRVAGSHPDAILRIAGDGEQRPEIEARIQILGLQERVSLLGFIPNSEVQLEMAWSDAFALVGWDEPFGVVYLEAMSAGKPIICCSDGGMAEIVEDGEHGLVVPPRSIAGAASALDRLLGSRSYRIGLGDAARGLFGRKFTWDRNAEQMRKLFEATLKKCTSLRETA